MENIYAFDIQLPCKFLNENWEYKKIILPHTKVRIETVLNPELISFFKLLNLQITSTELFYKKPFKGWDNNIHIDNHDNFDRARINYLIEDDSNSFLGFFKPKNIEVGKVSIGHAGGIPIRFKLEDVELVYKHAVKKPSVLQSGIPHSILNPSGDRYSLAVYISDAIEGYQLTFEQARERFKDFII